MFFVLISVNIQALYILFVSSMLSFNQVISAATGYVLEGWPTSPGFQTIKCLYYTGFVKKTTITL